MKPLTKENLLDFMAKVEQVSELRVGWRVADFYDWLGGKSRIPSYHRMKATKNQDEKDRLINYIYNRQFKKYKKCYIRWARRTFSPFLNSLQEYGKVEAISGRYGEVLFFKFEPLAKPEGAR